MPARFIAGVDLGSSNVRVVIAHAPTNREFKNSKAVLAGIEELKRRGVPFEFRLIENIPLEKLHDELQECDVLVEALNGWYYTLGVEAMSMNKVVVDSLNPRWKSKFVPDAPIVDVAPENVADALEKLLKNKAYRESVASKGRPFVLKHHDANVIARRLKAVYEGLRKP